MLAVFPPMDLPEPPKGPWMTSDITSFYDIFQTAQRVESNCVSILKQAGYQELGGPSLMPIYGRARPATNSHIQSAPNVLAQGPFSTTPASTPDPGTPRALTGLNPPTQSSHSDSGIEDGDADEADFHSHYSLGPQSDSEDSSDPASDLSNGEEEGISLQRPLLRHANSSFLSASAFAPPFYNKPPTPLPPSPSLTSLLRPSFSAATSRPTTPSSSENDTPNDTEAAVAKSARTATTVPRASPKVPTYEYYGFVLYLMSSMVFAMYILWSYLPSHFLHQLGIHYYPDRWWSLAIPSFLVMTLVYIYVALAAYNTEYLTLPMNSIENIVDETANIATMENQRIKKQNRLGEPKVYADTSADWSSLWDEGTDAVMDIPVGGVCQILQNINISKAPTATRKIETTSLPTSLRQSSFWRFWLSYSAAWNTTAIQKWFLESIQRVELRELENSSLRLPQWEGQSRKYYYVQRATGHSQWDVPTQPALSVPTPDPTPQPIGDPFQKPAMSSENGPNDKGDHYEGADRGFLSDLATGAISGKHNKPQNQSGFGGFASSLIGGQSSHGSGGHGGNGGLAGQLIGGILGGGKPQHQQQSQSSQHQSSTGGYGNTPGGHQFGGLGNFLGGHHSSSTYAYRGSRIRAAISATPVAVSLRAAEDTRVKLLLRHTSHPHTNPQVNMGHPVGNIQIQANQHINLYNQANPGASQYSHNMSSQPDYAQHQPSYSGPPTSSHNQTPQPGYDPHNPSFAPPPNPGQQYGSSNATAPGYGQHDPSFQSHAQNPSYPAYSSSQYPPTSQGASPYPQQASGSYGGYNHPPPPGSQDSYGPPPPMNTHPNQQSNVPGQYPGAPSTEGYTGQQSYGAQHGGQAYDHQGSHGYGQPGGGYGSQPPQGGGYGGSGAPPVPGWRA
ncbi:MAG: hypothetical protein Q9222_002266 [Ikaeria aurantiellina]